MGERTAPQRPDAASASLLTQATLAVLMLVLGALVYALDRPAEQVPLLAAVNQADATPVLFGFLGGSLPTFAHTFAFSLLTAVWLGGGKRVGLWICLAWFGTDTAFEVGQLPQVAERLAQLIPVWFERLPILGQAESYFLSGTFDTGDLISIAVGATAAYLITARCSTGDTRHG